MKKLLTMVSAVGLLCGFTAAQAGVTPEVQKDISDFQGFFKKRFPTVALSAYHDGVNALPQYAERRANWEILMEFPPYDPDMDKARKMWKTPLKSGKTYADCFKSQPPANKFPYYDAKKDDIVTVEAVINSCRKANGEEPIKNLKTGDIALLVAAYREGFNGKVMSVDVDSPGAVKWFKAGEKYYWTKRGQLNFACADCHVLSAGKKVRGDVLSPGLGHTTGFPVYRTKWALAGKPWGTVHRRYGGCNGQVRAQASKPQSDEYKALEYYEAVMNQGIPLKVPSQRQ